MVRLFVPINFSEHSINAAYYALKLGQKIPTVLTLVNCQAPLGDTNSYQDNKQDALNDFKDKLESEFNTQQKKNITLLTRQEEGYPEDVLISMSVKEEPDAIVMGTRSKGETIKELLGSVTSDVVKNANVPVLAVPANCMVDTERISNILFVTDFSDCDYRSIHKLIRLITPFQTKIFAVRFKASHPDKWDKKRQEEMRYYCRQTYRNYSIDFSFITGDDFISELDLFIKSNNIDLIAMTRHKRNMISKILHPSITRKILFHTDIPLLVFHE
ncbi:MAG: universal stress protein [Carboxylicivirga sp.]|jgi:nucleotide-binding universal stress UspA family protein|nr:universal stress protein [Carboxylicivirga sp.]MCT4645646.1 universal stress protein [Carboxylicivirga sp.]